MYGNSLLQKQREDCFSPVSSLYQPIMFVILSAHLKLNAALWILSPATPMAKCLPILLPVITKIVNLSLSIALMPDLLKLAIISPTLKKTHLNHEEFKNLISTSMQPRLSLEDH